MRPSWERYALGLAAAAAARSEDLHVKVGAVVLRPDRSIASLGYNGAPAGIDIDWTDRDDRRKYVIHAEANALRFTSPSEVAGGLLAVTHTTCDRCLPMVAAYGIKRIVFSHELLPVDGRPPATELVELAKVLGIRMGMPCPAVDRGRTAPNCTRDWPHRGPHINANGGFFYDQDD